MEKTSQINKSADQIEHEDISTINGKGFKEVI